MIPSRFLPRRQCCIALLVLLAPVASFVIAPRPSARGSAHYVVDGEPEFDPQKVLPEAEFESFQLLPHRPLGMTVEESLGDSRFVLVTKVVEGGNANQAGIQVGDVLVGVTGLFGDLTNVIGLEVNKM